MKNKFVLTSEQPSSAALQSHAGRDLSLVVTTVGSLTPRQISVVVSPPVEAGKTESYKFVTRCLQTIISRVEV